MKTGTVTSTEGPMIANEGCRAIGALFDQHHGLILQAAFRITGCEQDAEDVLQTIFMRLLNRPQLPDLQPSPRAYLHRAAVNAALDVVRTRKHDRTLPLGVLESLLEGNVAHRPDHQRSLAELRNWLRKAVAHLTPESAELFTLRFVEGYSNQEIAEMLGSTAGSIAVMLHRTRARLQQEIERMLGGKDHE